MSIIGCHQLSLNPSKTDFLVIGYSKQLAKLNHPTIHLLNDIIISLVVTACNLGVIFDSNLAKSSHHILTEPAGG
jgi:hypothetical protein